MNEQEYRHEDRRLWETVGLEPTEHWVELATTGTRVRVQEVGRGEPVLFVHGGPSAGSEWAPMLPHVEGLRCLLLDRPGTGLSEPFAQPPAHLLPEWPSIFARMVGDVLDGLGLERAQHVGGAGDYLNPRGLPILFQRAPFPHRVGLGLPRGIVPILPPFSPLVLLYGSCRPTPAKIVPRYG
jgi:hypothetical protein